MGAESAVTPNADAMVPLAFAPDGIRAHLLCSLLDSRGVDAHVVGEHTTALGPYGGGGSVSVLVRRGDFSRAMEELQGFCAEREEGERAEATETGGGAGGAGNRPRPCRVCGYDMSGLHSDRRCPECGVDPDALARVTKWIQLAPPPRDPAAGGLETTVEAAGAKMGLVVLIVAAAALVVLLVILLK